MMKQHITKKQWNELNKKEKKIILDWLLKKKLGLSYFNIKFGDCYYFNIGQMIEFLGENNWEKDLFFAYKGDYNIYRKDEWTNFCDTLWKKVKYKLKNL